MPLSNLRHDNCVPRVTIGLPVYNGADYLAEALDSLLGQSYGDFEIIISDNNSDDKTGLICRDYQEVDKRIKYIHHHKSIGGIENFQFVLNEARGNYFMWAAHDDLWDKDYLATLVPSLEKETKSVLACCKIVGIDEGNNVIWNCPWTFSLPSSVRLVRLIKYICQDDYHRKPVLIYGLMRTSAIKVAGGCRTWSVHSCGTALHVVLSILIQGNISVSREVSFYKRKVERKCCGDVKIQRETKYSNFILKRIESFLFLIKEAKSHNFIKYLDGYGNVIFASSLLSFTEKIMLKIFLFFWRGYLFLSLLARSVRVGMINGRRI